MNNSLRNNVAQSVLHRAKTELSTHFFEHARHHDERCRTNILAFKQVVCHGR
jgi:hypothetical protein